jgi:hypothetical protein
VRRRDHPRVHNDRTFAADPLQLAFLQHSQQLGLHRSRHVPDLVEEQRAAMRLLEFPKMATSCAGERALLMPEQFRLDRLIGTARVRVTNGLFRRELDRGRRAQARRFCRHDARRFGRRDAIGRAITFRIASLFQRFRGGRAAPHLVLSGAGRAAKRFRPWAACARGFSENRPRRARSRTAMSTDAWPGS